MEIAFAIAKLGAIFLPLNWRLTGRELRLILNDAAPYVWFVSGGLSELANQADRPDIQQIAVGDGSYGNADAYSAIVARGSDSDVQPPASSTDRWTMIYTSGTTGQPKGTILSQQAWCVMSRGLGERRRLGVEDCYLGMMPLFHVAGLHFALSHFCHGAASYFLPKPPAPDVIHRLLEKQCTTAWLQNPHYGEVLHIQKRRRAKLRVRSVYFRGTLEAQEEAQRVLGVSEIWSGYGQTEACGFAAEASLAERLVNPETCGRLLSCCQGRILDEQGAPLPGGAEGELELSGPGVMTGYWNNPDATHAALREGWLRTGDIMRMDEHGYLVFIDRARDLIRSGGENVYPSEVEAVLQQHPSIKDCCVVGVPDATWGESIKAFLVLRNNAAITGAELTAWCKERIAGYKRPRYMEIIDAIPGAENFKRLRKDLRQRPLAAHQRLG